MVGRLRMICVALLEIGNLMGKRFVVEMDGMKVWSLFVVTQHFGLE